MTSDPGPPSRARAIVLLTKVKSKPRLGPMTLAFFRKGEELEATGMVEATNVFLHTPSGWRMLVHHASPSPLSKRVTSVPPERLH